MILFAIAWLAGCAEIQKPVQTELVSEEEPMVSSEDKGSFIPDGYYEEIPPVPEKGYFLEMLAKNVYFFSTGTYNNLFVATDEGVFITDPIGGKGKLIKQAIAEVTNQPVRFMVYTHSHIDHIGDAFLFADGGVQIIAHKETRRLLERYDDANRPIPHLAFERNYILNFGGLRIELIFVEAGHDKGNIMVYIPYRKILMLVDVATPKSVPFKNFSTVDIFGQIIGVQKALKLDWDRYVAGHLYRPGNREEMQEALNYYYASKDANALALKRVSFKEVLGKTQSKDMERIFGEYYEAVAEECYRILKPKWKPRLMGFEAFARGHCDVWTSFHRTHKSPADRK